MKNRLELEKKNSGFAWSFWPKIFQEKLSKDKMIEFLTLESPLFLYLYFFKYIIIVTSFFFFTCHLFIQLLICLYFDGV